MIWFTRASNRLPERSMASTKPTCPSSRPLSRSSSVVPRRLLRGLRISWLTLARNSDFASLACSASTRWRTSSRRTRLASVMSSAMP